MSLYISPFKKGTKVLNELSNYQPDDETRQLFAAIRKDYAAAQVIRDQPYEEFNDRDLIQYMNDCQKSFN